MVCFLFVHRTRNKKILEFSRNVVNRKKLNTNQCDFVSDRMKHTYTFKMLCILCVVHFFFHCLHCVCLSTHHIYSTILCWVLFFPLHFCLALWFSFTIFTQLLYNVLNRLQCNVGKRRRSSRSISWWQWTCVCAHIARMSTHTHTHIVWEEKEEEGVSYHTCAQFLLD